MFAERDAVTPELSALAALMADWFRERSVPLVVASQAGLDTSLIPSSDVIADLWWNVVERAQAEGRLAELVEVAKRRVGVRGAVLDQAYKKVVAAEPKVAISAEPPRIPRRRTPPAMSDYRSIDTVRIDQLQRDLGAVQTQVAVLIEQNKTIITQQQQAAFAWDAMQKRLLWISVSVLLPLAVVGVMVAVHLFGGANESSGSHVDSALGGLALVGGLVWGLFPRSAVGAGAGGPAADCSEGDPSHPRG